MRTNAYSDIIITTLISCFLLCSCQSPSRSKLNQTESVSLLKKTNFNNTKCKFSTKIKVSSDDPLDDSDDIYAENENLCQGIYEYQGLVFVVIEIDLSQKHEIEPEGVAMLQEKDILCKKYDLPKKFMIYRKILENGENVAGTFYRYTTVYRLKDILALRQNNHRK